MNARAFACVVLCSSMIASAAESQSFEAIGRAPISSGDRVRARQRALDDALQHAIEAAVSELLGPEVLTRRAADLRLKIMPRAKTYVSTYRVLEEGELEAGTFVIRVSAEVAGERLVRELSDKPRDARLSAPVAAPRAALCIAVEPAGALAPKLEAAARAHLTTSGFDPFVPAKCDGDGPGPVALASGARAALLIELQPERPEPIRGTSLVGRNVKLSVRFSEVDGRHAADGHAESAGYGKTADDATDDGAVLALHEAMPAVDGALGTAAGIAAQGGAVVTRLIGVHRFAQLGSVRASIERVPGVTRVEPRRFIAGQPATIELAVYGGPSARDLAHALGRSAAQLHARDVDGQLVIEVVDSDTAAAPGAPQ